MSCNNSPITFSSGFAVANLCLISIIKSLKILQLLLFSVFSSELKRIFHRFSWRSSCSRKCLWGAVRRCVDDECLQHSDTLRGFLKGLFTVLQPGSAASSIQIISLWIMKAAPQHLSSSLIFTYFFKNILLYFCRKQLQ